MLDGARQNADCMLYIPRIIIMGVCQNFCHARFIRLNFIKDVRWSSPKR